MDYDEEKLREIYLNTERQFIKDLILEHPKCPKELKIAEEL